MDVQDIVELLESKWQSIREQLGEKWDEFVSAYRSIIATLPEEPTRADLERIADDICSLMRRYDYTLGLLLDWQNVLSERLLQDTSETLSEQEQVRQIGNRFKQLAYEEPSQAEQKGLPCEGKPAG